MWGTILSLLGTVLPKVLNRLLPGEDETIAAKRLEIQAALQQELAQVNLAQLQINMAEAAAPGRTWMTWREILGYICAVAVGYHFVIQQVLAFFCNLFGHPAILPSLDMTGLMTILSAMLGVHFVDSKYNSPLGERPNPDNIAERAMKMLP